MNPMDFGKVAVLLGGYSAEREVSLVSGQGVFEALLRQNIDAHTFDPAEKDICDLAGFDRAFIILHGRGGEDGVIQGVLDHLHIPYTGSRVPACALAMDKWRSKLVWQAAGLPTPAYSLLDEKSNFVAIAARLGLPLFVKPVTEGSSIGVSKVHSVDEFAAAYALAQKYDSMVIAEQDISSGEYTVGIVGDKILPAIKIVPATEFYDYEAKYERDDTQYLVPCGLAIKQEKQMQSLAQEAFRMIGGRGWGRVDILTDKQNNPYVLEANLVPGMTTHSLIPKAAAATGIDYDQLVLEILTQTLRDQ